jgi:hypothetical protein
MEVVLLSTKEWVIEQIIHASLLATAEAKGCSCQFSPDKSTVR